MYPDEGPLHRGLYPKHISFFEMGAEVDERCVMAANRVGKTEGIGGPEVTYHLTGKYPHWWKGRRFDRATTWWASGTTNKKTQEIIQTKMLGPVGKMGTGLIPGELIVRTIPKPGIPDAIGAVFVRHVSGGISALTFKSYEMGREAFEGNEVDGIWLDEEPPAVVYFECLTRTMSTEPGKRNGMLIATFTPLEGLTETALLFAPGGAIKDGVNPDTGRYTLNLTWDDAPHLTKEAKDKMLLAYPPYMRDARTKGIPQLGSGAIYPVPESEIKVPDFKIPDHWPRAYAMDVGWNCTAVVWIAVDPETKTKYLYSVHRQGHAEPSVHARTIKARGEWIPGKIDPAARGRGQKDGAQLLQDYQDLGLKVSPADNAVETGLLRVWEALSGGEFKVFESCEPWFMEYRIYRRDDKGHIVKKDDHLMDATRYWFTSAESIACINPALIAKKTYVPPRAFGTGAVFGGKR